MNFKIANPTRIYFGENSIINLKTELKNVKNLLLVYGGGSIKKSGLYNELIAILDEMKIIIIELSGVKANPTLDKVYEGKELCLNHEIDFILAVGGGSVIDCSKAIAVAAKYKGDIWDVIKYKKEANEKVNLGTILTLSATSTENNYFSVISKSDTLEKVGWAIWPLNFPTFSILDPKYTLTVPKDQTINGIVDILSHLMENYFNEQDSSDSIIKLHNKELEILMVEMISIGKKIVDDLENLKLREAMMYIGSQALSTKIRHVLGGNWSCHMMEHSLSAVYDIPHGGGLAIILPRWMEYVVERSPAKFVGFAKNVMQIERKNETDIEYAKKGIEEFTQFLEDINAPLHLSYYNINDDKIDELVEKSMGNNELIGGFTPLNKTDVRKIILSSLN